MSSPSRVNHIAAYAAAAVAVSVMVAGCGSAGSKAAGPTSTALGPTATALGPAAGPSSTSVPTSAAVPATAVAVPAAGGAIGAAMAKLDVSKQCSAIPAAHLQALLKTPAGSANNHPLECAWSGTTMHVDLSPDDADQHSYKELSSMAQGHPISGLGDLAQWFQPVAGATLPVVVAHKGSLTCFVQPPDDITTTTLRYTGSDPFYKIADADALAYATALAKLCADVFSVS